MYSSIQAALPEPMTDFPLCSIVREGDAADTKSHTHSCGQLLYPQQGVTLLETRKGIVRLGPDRAAWIPTGEEHSVFMDRRYRYHSLYSDPRLSPRGAVKVLLIRPLLRELIVDAATWSDASLTFKEKYRRARVIVDEINRAPLREAGVCMPGDRRLSIIFRDFENDPSSNKLLQQWAKELGASGKTLQRLFQTEMGMSFRQWRNHLRMTRALELHAQGWRLLDIALAVGYATEGAYAQAFKRFFGHPPSALRQTDHRQ